MPQKKKCKRKAPVALSTARSYIEEHFSTLPIKVTDTKNGHILKVFWAADNSRIATERVLRKHFNCLDELSFRSRIISKIMRVVRSFQRLHRLDNQDVYNKFLRLCNETFEVIEQSVQDINEVSQLIPGIFYNIIDTIKWGKFIH